MIVIKIGGSIAHQCNALLDELVNRRDVVVVHGFSPQTDALAAERGIAQRFITSPAGARSRYTDEATLSVAVDAARDVGARLSQRLEARGLGVAHLMGNDGLLRAQVKPVLREHVDGGRVVLVRGNRSGRVVDVDAGPLLGVLAEGRMPVVTPVGFDEDGAVSLDGDRAAAAIAAALPAETLLLLTDVKAVRDGGGRPIDRLPIDAAHDLISSGVASGGMVRKLLAADEAVRAGVERVVIGPGTTAAPLAAALAGSGTEVVA